MKGKLQEKDDTPSLKSGEKIVGWDLGRLSPSPTHVPSGWELLHLTSVAKLESGHTPSRRRPEYWEGDIPWISLHDSSALDVREISSTAQTIGPLGLANSSARLLPKGTVVFSRTATVGKATVMGREMATSQDFANYICGERIQNYFLVYLFRYMAPEWRRLMAGSTHNSIYMPVFRHLQILLPPRLEQEAIAEALSDADTLIESLEQLIAKKRHLKQGAMQELLRGKRRLHGFTNATIGHKQTEIGTIPDDWDLCPLGKGIKLLSGHHVLAQHCNTDGDGVPYITGPADFPNGVIQHTKFTTNPETICCANDILLTVKGSGTGTPILADANYCISRQLMAIRTTDWKTRYVYFSLLQDASLFGAAATGLIPGLSRRDILNKLIPVPPTKAEQEAIAAVLSDMDAEIAAVKAKLAKYRQLKQGMMHNLLTGKIRLI